MIFKKNKNILDSSKIFSLSLEKRKLALNNYKETNGVSTNKYIANVSYTAFGQRSFQQGGCCKTFVSKRDSSYYTDKDKVVSITYEEIGLFPRSFSRVLDRFLKQLFSDVDNLVIQEYRFYRYLFLTTIKTIFILFFVPFLVNFAAKNYIVKPITEYFWNTSHPEIFLNLYEQKRAFAELEKFEEKIYFETLVEAHSQFMDPALRNYTQLPETIMSRQANDHGEKISFVEREAESKQLKDTSSLPNDKLLETIKIEKKLDLANSSLKNYVGFAVFDQIDIPEGEGGINTKAFLPVLEKAAKSIVPLAAQDNFTELTQSTISLVLDETTKTNLNESYIAKGEISRKAKLKYVNKDLSKIYQEVQLNPQTAWEPEQSSIGNF